MSQPRSDRNDGTGLANGRVHTEERAHVGTLTCAFLTLVLAFVSGCGDIAGGIKSLRGQKAPDFLKTEIVENGPSIADGISDLILLVHLKNSDLSPVTDYTPTYEIIEGEGVIGASCTASTVQGVSACVLRATVPGAKRFRLTNARVGLEKVVTFDPAQRGGRQGIVAGSLQNGTTAAGHKIQSSVGHSVGVMSATTDRGFKGTFSVQGQTIKR